MGVHTSETPSEGLGALENLVADGGSLEANNNTLNQVVKTHESNQSRYDQLWPIYGKQIMPIIPVNGIPTAKSNLTTDRIKDGKIPAYRYYPGKKGCTWSSFSWTKSTSKKGSIRTWVNWPDHAVAVRSKQFPGVDIDIDDLELAQQVYNLLMCHLPDTATRTRDNSSRMMLSYKLAEGETPQKKVVITLPGDAGMIEFLGDGQQYILSGMHKSGDMQLLAGEPVIVTVDQLHAAQQALIDQMDGKATTGKINGKKLGHSNVDLNFSGKLGKDWEKNKALLSDALSTVTSATMDDGKPVGYDLWFKIGAAIHKESNGSEDGLEMFITWSEPHPDFDADECRAKWLTMDAEKDGAAGIGTLLMLCKDQGWKESIDFSAFSEIMKDAPVGDTEITPENLSESAISIAETISFDDADIEEKMSILMKLIVPMKTIARERTKKILIDRKVLTASTFNSAVKDATPEGSDLSEEDQAELEDSILNFNKSHAVVSFDGKTAVMNTQTFKPMSVYDAKNYYANLKTPGDKPLFEMWMEHRIRHTCSSVVFEPGRLPGILGKKFNMYQGMAVAPVEGDWSLINDHLLRIWCNGNVEIYKYLLNWVAQMVQLPGRPGGTVITLGDKAEGAGTGIITDIFLKWFDPHSMAGTRRSDVTGKFNSKIALSVFVLMNEATWSGDREEQGVMKALTTDPYHLMELKGIEKIMVKNCTHIIVTSNNAEHSAVGRDDRRNLTLECSDVRKGDRKYFQALGKQIASGGSEAFLQAMLVRDIQGFIAGDMPVQHSAQRTALKINSLPPEARWFIEVVRHGDTTNKSKGLTGVFTPSTWLYRPGDAPSKVDWNTEELRIDKRTVLDDCNAYIRYPVTATGLTQTLKKMLGLSAKELAGQKTHDGKRAYNFPPRWACMDGITAYLGGTDPFIDDSEWEDE